MQPLDVYSLHNYNDVVQLMQSSPTRKEPKILEFFTARSASSIVPHIVHASALKRSTGTSAIFRVLILCVEREIYILNAFAEPAA